MMKRKGFLLALVLVIVVNAIVLSGVAYNRSGTATAHLILSARELPLSWGYGSEENTGLSLRIVWNHSTDKTILTQEKLESLGFSFPETREIRSPKNTKQPLPRKAYAVLEYNGNAWVQLLKKRQDDLAKSLENAKTDQQREMLQKNYDQFEKNASRLVLVDVGVNPTSLRAQYSDTGKYLITQARVTAYAYFKGNKNNPFKYEINGAISELLPDTIYVPRQFHNLIQKPGQRRPAYYDWNYRPDNISLPQYQVTLDYGKRYEPWVESVSPGIPAP